jgi:hypothetical protein
VRTHALQTIYAFLLERPFSGAHNGMRARRTVNVSKLREILSQLPILTTLVLVFLASLITYAVVSYSGGSQAPTNDYPKGFPVIFNAITDPTGTRYLPYDSNPADTFTVSNPVTVAMAIGGGRLYQTEGDPVLIGYGHLHVLIDSPLPSPGDTVAADDTHIDLADASHVLKLPALSPGEHTISAVWTDSRNNTGGGLLASATIKIDVSPPSS